MKLSRGLLGFVTVLALLSLIHGYSYTKYYMDKLCRGSITLKSMTPIEVDLTSRSTYKSNMNCVLKINAASGDRFMAEFRSFSVELSTSCQDDSLSLYDGSSIASPPLTGRNGLCGFTTPSKVYTSSSNSLTLEFVSDLSFVYSGFSLIFTPFTGVCRNGTSSYRCRNTRCIRSGLTCDGWNNCGDDSDEIEGCGLSVGGIAGIAVSVIVICFIFVVIGFVCRRRRLAYVSAGRPGYAVTKTTTTTYGSPAPPPAGFAGYQQPPSYSAAGQYQPSPAGAYPQ